MSPSGLSARTVGRSRWPRFPRPVDASLRSRGARAARAKKLAAVGLLDSSRYASLHPGYWIVFSGIYASEAEATSALEDARGFARSASVRRVVP